MKRIAIDDVDHPPTISPASVVRPLAGPLGTTDLSLNYFELAPGETIGFDYHRHLDQEELFVIQSGTVCFRTEDGSVDIEAGEAVRFAPGEFQLGRNDGPERVRLLAIGAPRDSTEIEYFRECSACEGETKQELIFDPDAGVLEIVCSVGGHVVDRFEFDD